MNHLLQSNDNAISSERLALIGESILRQLRSGRTIDEVRAGIAYKGLVPEFAEKIVDEVYEQYVQETKYEHRYDNDQPISSVKKGLGLFFRGLIAWVLSVITGHFINPNHLPMGKSGKRDEERIQ